jgi:hypothetical protein
MMTELDRRFVTGAMRPFHKDVDEDGNSAMHPRAPPIASEATENFNGQEAIAATVTNASVITVDLDDETLSFQGAELLRRCVQCFASMSACTFFDHIEQRLMFCDIVRRAILSFSNSDCKEPANEPTKLLCLVGAPQFHACIFASAVCMAAECRHDSGCQSLKPQSSS